MLLCTGRGRRPARRFNTLHHVERGRPRRGLSLFTDDINEHHLHGEELLPDESGPAGLVGGLDGEGTEVLEEGEKKCLVEALLLVCMI